MITSAPAQKNDQCDSCGAKAKIRIKISERGKNSAITRLCPFCCGCLASVCWETSAGRRS